MSLCPHGYTAFWDCPTCEEPMGTAPSEKHEFGCTAYVGRPCICATLRLERMRMLPHSQHARPVPACLDCEDALAEARALQSEQPWNK